MYGFICAVVFEPPIGHAGTLCAEPCADPSSGGLPRAGVRLAAPASGAHARAVGAAPAGRRRLPRKPRRPRAPGPRGFGASGAAGIPACAACPRIRGPVRAFLRAVRCASRPAGAAGNVSHRLRDRTSPRVCPSMTANLNPSILARCDRMAGGTVPSDSGGALWCHFERASHLPSTADYCGIVRLWDCGIVAL